MQPIQDRPSPSARLLHTGDLVGGRYRLDRDVRATDTGVVHSALDVTTGRTVAIELATRLVDASARNRFARDAMVAQRFEGDHVMQVLARGTLEDGTPWIAREVVISSIAGEVSRRGRIGTQQAVAWALEICEAVAEAHALGMAHGDIRPDTVHIARGAGGAPIVKVQWPTGAKARRQVKEDLGRDIRGIGNVLRALCTGRITTLDVDVEDAPTVPSDVVRVVTRATAVDGPERFENLAELARALAPHAPPGHDGARNTEYLLSRAGLVTSTPSLPTVPRASAASVSPTSAHETNATLPLPTPDVPPSSVRRVKVERREPVGDDWLVEEFDLPAARSSRATRFAAVSFFLVGAAIAATMVFSRTGTHFLAAPAPQLAETATSGEVEPETIAWADGVVDVAIEDFGRSLPAMESPAVREVGVVAQDDAQPEAAASPTEPTRTAPPAPTRPTTPPEDVRENPAVPTPTAPPSEPTSPLPSTTPAELPPQPIAPSS